MKRFLLALMGLGLFAVAPATAQEPAASPSPEATAADDTVKREEVVVVTASKVETTLINAPVTMSVVTSEQILTSAAQNYGDILRNVPGVNVIQTSARDINIVSRQAVGTLTNSQLALLDGRSIYLDFFGMVLWDFVPSNFADIKQIEVVRGPASAVWGANAFTGVVNIITKSPREASGGYVSLSGGLFDRDAGTLAGDDSGKSFGTTLSYSGAPNDKWSYRLAGGYFNSDPLARPTGTVPVRPHPLDPSISTGGGTFSSFQNEGTSQPKFDGRLDYDSPSGARLTFAGGYAGTAGIIHTGIGPFNIEKGSNAMYGKVNYSKGALRLNAFANLVSADAPNLQSVDVSGQPLFLSFDTKTYDFELGHSAVFAGHHVLSYGGNARRNMFDITIAPTAEDRTELGAYIQDEIFYDKFRLTVGARVDKFGNLDDPVFSPRATAMFKPAAAHAFRLSYNRAFRSPSVINNYLDITIKGVDFPLRTLCLAVPALCQNPAILNGTLGLGPRAIGSEVARGINPGLPEQKEEAITAYEVGYTGTFGGRTTVGVAYYINDQDDGINFTTTPSVIAANGLPALFTPSNPPPGWVQLGLPVQLLAVPALRAAVFDRVPATYTYLNLGPVRNKGLELSIDHAFSRGLNGFVNYSWQADPEVLDPDSGQRAFPIAELAVPPHNRVNAGLNYDSEKWLGSANVNWVDEGFYNDVLGSLGFDGFVEGYTMLNASLGIKFNQGKWVATIKGTNLTNEEIQQHVFGDILKRSLSAELRVSF
jgi:outer membrane receptor protein involved in Fe transport